MDTLVSKDENAKTSMVYVGALVLKALEKAPDERLSLTAIAKILKSHGINKSRPLTFSLMFLHLADIIEFQPPYIYKRPS
jgi:hypothetical protein